MPPTKSVQLIAFSRMSFLDISGPLDVFLTANLVVDGPHQPYDISVLSPAGSVEMPASISIHTDALSEDTAPPHTLIVPGGPGIHAFCEGDRFKSIFEVHAKKASRLASVCTGAFALAAAGLLDGRRATTHWQSYDDLESRFPKVLVKRGPIFVNDGHIWTSAGVTAGIDLALAMVEQDLGQAVALEIARNLVMFLKRPGDQAQFSVPLTLQSESGRFSDLHAWMSANLAEDLSIPVLATRMNMSERSFLRHYRSHTRRTPSKVVEALRLEAARHLLLNTDHPMKDIAARCGFGNEATFLRRFGKSFGTSPGQHRAHFGSQMPD